MSKPEKAKHKLTIEFDNQRALKHFAIWMCESGEQHYWKWMARREEMELGDITAINFIYHIPNEDPRKEAKFLADNTIRTTCGRFSGDDEE